MNPRGTQLFAVSALVIGTIYVGVMLALLAVAVKRGERASSMATYAVGAAIGVVFTRQAIRIARALGRKRGPDSKADS